MKILIVNEDLELGGIETMSVQLANGLGRKPNVSAYVASASGPLVERLTDPSRHFFFPKYRIATIGSIIVRLAQIISEIKPDLVHSQGATLAILAGMAIRKAGSNAVNVLTRHSRSPIRLPRNLAVFLLKRLCDHIVAISKSSYRDLINAGIDEHELSLIPNFIDFHAVQQQLGAYDRRAVLSELEIAPGSGVAIMVGRLIPAKRFDRFIEMLARAAQGLDRPLVGLVLGDGEERERLEQLAENVSHRVRIVFPGYQSEIFKFLAISDLFLFPSEHPEVLPMALIEALAAGTPIICSNIPGNNEIIDDGYNGFLVDHREADYIDRIHRVLCDHAFARLIAENGVTTAQKKYDINVVIDELLRLYQRLLDPQVPNKGVDAAVGAP